MADTPAPKSPSPRRTSGKQRAVRIPLDYYKSRDPLGRIRLALVALAPIVALGWWFGDRLLRGDRAEIHASHGPLWAGHATWETDCQACHAPFEPIKSDAAFASRGSTRLAGSDRRCSSCHAGPVHHANQLATKAESCGGCHRDHRGRDADLNRVPDQQCSICHADLPHAIQGGSPEGEPNYLNVSRFDVDHPDLAIRAPSPDGLGAFLGRLTDDGPPVRDPSNLKFDHDRHLTAGLDARYTFADLDEADRARYGWTSSTPLETPVRLDCASCHLLDGGDLPLATDASAGRAPARSTGAFMLPISYEASCRACHKLTVGVPEDGRPPLDVPHQLQPAELRRFLERTFAAEALDADPSPLDRPASQPAGAGDDAGSPAGREAIESLRALLSDAETRLPGKSPGSPTLGASINEEVRKAEGTLYLGSQTCTECHEYDRSKGPDPSGWTVLPTAVPEIWFPHASFSHVAHRAVDCAGCHASAETSTTSDDILLPPISSCRQCHAPAEYSRGEVVRGGARFDCVECHRYHNGDRPLQGIGALARQVDEEQRRSVEAFLRGETALDSPTAGTPGAE